MTAFFFDNTAFQESSHEKEIDLSEMASFWVPDKTIMSYVIKELCPFCEAPLKHYTWFADCGAQIYDELTTESSVCNRCGFWTYINLCEANGKLTCKALTSRVKEFDITDLNAPIQGMIKWLKMYPKDMYYVHPRTFELVVRDILNDYLGCELCLTKTTRDGGIDLIGFDSVNGKFVVEVKRYAQHNRIGVKVVRQIAGVLLRENVQRGIIVSTSEFTHDAKKEAEVFQRNNQLYPVNIDMLSMSQLLSWMAINDSRLQHTSEDKYWQEQLRKVLKGEFYSWDEFEEWQKRHQKR